MSETQKRTFGPKVETRLAQRDTKRLDEQALLAGKTRAQIARQALLFYLDNLESQKVVKHEGEIATAIKYASDQIVKGQLSGVDRICGMLARQGAAIETLFELTRLGMVNTTEGQEAFMAAVTTAKSNQRKRLDNDERILKDKIKGVVTS
jgi:hypothetical protein